MCDMDRMNNNQIYLGTEIMQICQDMMNELQELCLQLGYNMTRDEIIEVIKARFHKRLDKLKLEIQPEWSEDETRKP